MASSFTGLRTGILGTGSYLPERVLTNANLEKMVDTSAEWIVARTGVRERRVAAPHEATSDLSYQASLKALEMAGRTPADLDLIVVATLTPDTCCPAAACWLQGKLGATRAVAFDLNAACSGFIFGLSTVDAYLRAGLYRTVLLVGAEIMTRTVNWKSRETCILWGDGAGAVILGGFTDTHGILSIHIHSDGTFSEMLQVPMGGSRVAPITQESVLEDRHTLRMMGKESFRIAVRAMAEACQEALVANGVAAEEIALVIPHQANLRIMTAVAEMLGLPEEKVYVTIHKYGNISSATIPIALDEAVREGRVKRGDLVLLTAFGGGLTWGSALIRF